MSVWFYVGCGLLGLVAFAVFMFALCSMASRFDRVEEWFSR